MIIKTTGNKLFMYGTIWEGDGVYFLDVFSRMDGTYPEIEVHIHCNGGSVFDGNLIMNTILSAKSACDAYIDGIAASMAAIIVMAFRKIFMAENGYLMIHEPKGVTYGNAKQHEANAGLMRSMETNFQKKLVARTGKKPAEVKKWLDGDNWFDADQALEAGLIDGIIDPVTQVKIEDPTANLDNTFNSFAALLVTSEADTNDKTLLKMKKEAIAKFGLTGVNEQSSDTAVIEAIEAHFKNITATLQTSLDEKTTAFTNLETQVSAQRDTQIKTLLDDAQAKNKITAAQRDTYESIGKTSGVTALETVLSGINGRQSITNQLGGKKGGAPIAGREGWDWDKYQKEMPRQLEAMAKDDPETFAALYEAKFKKPFKN